METAGACADLRCRAIVVPFGVANAVRRRVHGRRPRIAPPFAERSARLVRSRRPRTRSHKIDSTLRGGWAHEIVGRQQAHAVRVVVAAAFPAAGRVCVDGVVYVDGVPVAEGAAATDARSLVHSSRPADYLRDAGASAVDAVTPSTLAAVARDGRRPLRGLRRGDRRGPRRDRSRRGPAPRRHARGHGCSHRRSRPRRVAARRSSA